MGDVHVLVDVSGFCSKLMKQLIMTILSASEL